MDFAWLDEAAEWAEEAVGLAGKKWAEAQGIRPEEGAWAAAWTMVARAERAASTAWAEVERRNWEYDALDPGGMLVPGIGSADVQIRLMAGRRDIADAGRRSTAAWSTLAEWAARARRAWPPRADGGVDLWAAAEIWAAAEMRARQAVLDVGTVRMMNKNLEETKKFIANGKMNRAGSDDATDGPPDGRPPKTGMESNVADAEQAAAAAEQAAMAAASAYERALGHCRAAAAAAGTTCAAPADAECGAREGIDPAEGGADDWRLA